MKAIRFCLLALSLTLSLTTVAQDEVEFTADRPGATTGPDVLPRGRVQWETGMGWERSKLDGPAVTTWTLNTTLLRWGFSDFAELRLQGDYLFASGDGDDQNGFSDVAVGTKVKLFEGWKAVPAISLLANVIVPGGHDADFLPREWGGQIGLVFQNELTPWLSLGYDGELIWSDHSKPSAFYGLCLGFSLSDRCSLGLEEYNVSSSGDTESWSEISVAYQLSRRVQLDAGFDISLNYPKRFQNLMIGVAWEIASGK